MKQILVVFALLACIGTGALALNTQPASASHGQDPTPVQLSTMVVQVQGVVNNEQEAKRVRKAILRVNGVRDVSVCTTSGNVSISYDKPAMGCCSVLHTAMQSNNVQYTLVSNREAQSCSRSAGQGASTGTQQEAAPRCGQGTQGTQGAQSGQAPACCQQRARRNS